MQKDYPVLYCQQNYSDPLGNSPSATIASDGCFVTSFAMKATFYGTKITPSQLNQLFKDRGLYAPLSPGSSIRDLLSDYSLQAIYPNMKYVKTIDYEPIPTDLAAIKTLLDDPATTVTIRINLGNGNLHFVEAVGCDGQVLTIANPWDGSIENFSKDYGNPVTANIQVIVYMGPIISVVPATVTNAQAPAVATPSPLATTFNNAITKSGNFDVVADYLGISQTDRIKTTAGQTAVDMYTVLQKHAQDADEENQKLLESSAKTSGSVSATTVQTTTTITPPSAPTATLAMFKDGTLPTSSAPAETVTSPPPPPTNVRSISLFDRIWTNIKFWIW